MSDYFGNDPGKQKGKPDGANPWQGDPFAAYDDPAMNPAPTAAPQGGTGAPAAPAAAGAPDYSAWRRPAGMPQPRPSQERAEGGLPQQAGAAPRAANPYAPPAGAARPAPQSTPQGMPPRRPAPGAADGIHAAPRRQGDPYAPAAEGSPAPQGMPPRRPAPGAADGMNAAPRRQGDPYAPAAEGSPAPQSMPPRRLAPGAADGMNAAPRRQGDPYAPAAEGSPAPQGMPQGMPPRRPAQPSAEPLAPTRTAMDSAAPAARPAFPGARPQPAADAAFGIVSADGAQRPPHAELPGDEAFSAMGADAPTRIARPLGTQQVSKHKTVERGAGNPFARADAPAPAQELSQPAAQDDGGPRRRRAGRAARYDEGGESMPGGTEQAAGFPAADVPPSRRMAPGAPYLPPEGRQYPAFDPFAAGDSETRPPEADEPPAADEPDRALRRPAMPGERYTGARTAMPMSGAPVRRGQVGEPYGDPADGYDPVAAQRPQGMPPQGQRPPRMDENARPVAAQRPQGMPPQGQRPPRIDENGRPVAAPRPQGMPPQGQRPPRMDENGRPVAAQRPQDMPPQGQRPLRDEGYPQRGNEGFDPRRTYPEPRPRASVERPAYDFEDEGEEAAPRRGGVLIPLLTVLLVLGGLLAGILLPNWKGMDSGLGSAMGKIQDAVKGVFSSVVSLVSPDAGGVKGISVSPSAATAPVDLVFNVQASASVTQIRILDQNGVEILSKTLTDGDLLNGTVVKNSSNNIWTLRYTCGGAYGGVFTAQALLGDGTWEEGVTLAEPVSIAPPLVVEPPVQSFEADTQAAAVPATVGFTVVTSTDVTAVQIINDYGTAVAQADLATAGEQMTESDGTRTWSLSAEFADPYAGSFYAGYLTSAEADFVQADYSVDVTLEEEGAQAPEPDEAALALGGDEPAADALAETPEPATPEPTAAPTKAPEATPAPEPTAAPTPLPILTVTADEAAAPTALKLDAKAYEDLKLKDSYSRTEKSVFNDPFKYAVWDQSGVLTFRGDSFRQNAAYGTAEIVKNTLTELWRVPVEGSIKAKSASLTGVGWPGQAIIVKWPTQLRTILALSDAAKNKQALKEVILGAQNGKIYFLDLITGEATREPIENDWPSNGAMSLDTNATPMLAVGQHVGVLAKKTVDNGLHLYNLMSNKQLLLLKGKEKLARSNYSGFSSAPLFDKNTGLMVVGGENGLLYTMDPGDEFDHVLASLKLTPATQRYSWLAGKQKAKNTNIDGGVAMYGPYAYFGDQSGIVQCVDINTLSPVWAVNTGDNVDATIALDMESDSAVALYTANTILNQGRSGVCTIRRLDALSGKQTWAFTVPDLTYTTEAEVGVVASPVVGRQKVSDLVFFTATNGTRGATLYALSKQDGAVKWSLPLAAPTISSPVAVYNAAGDAWLVQADGAGTLSLIDARTGAVKNTLKLEGNVEGSPAVYRDVLVIGTTGGDSSYIYGIKLE